MNKSIPFRINVASALLCLILFASCSADDDTALPEGKYPMTFATAMEGLTQTRATTDNTWAGDEKIAVQVGSEVKQYIPTNSNPATLVGADAANTFYWQKADETKLVSAWYCGDGSAATNQTNASKLPTAWTVKTDQSGSGYTESDFLYAPAKSIAYNPQTGTNSLTFYHQTAKVVINVRNDEKGFLTNADRIQSVSINNVKLVGLFSVPISGSNYGLTTGDALPGIITAKKLTKPNMGLDFGYSNWNETALASYEALVIPQTVTPGKEFIGIEVNGTVFYYKAEAEKNVLNAGRKHTYNIAVKGEKLQTGTVSSDMNWVEGESSSGSIQF